MGDAEADRCKIKKFHLVFFFFHSHGIIFFPIRHHLVGRTKPIGQHLHGIADALLVGIGHSGQIDGRRKDLSTNGEPEDLLGSRGVLFVEKHIFVRFEIDGASRIEVANENHALVIKLQLECTAWIDG